ncbi:MAG: type II secretion system F family protein [Gemmataceae bacterium]
MNDWIQFGGVFLAVSALAFVVIMLFRRSVLREPDRVPEPVDEPEELPENDLVLGEYTTALSGSLTKPGGKLSDLQQDLRSAGYYRPTAIVEYRAVRNLLVLMAVLLTATLALLVTDRRVVPVLIVGVIVAGLAYSLPRVYLFIRGRNRSRAIERGLPLAIDLMILCLSAGQNLLAALLQVARQLRNSHPVLAQELTIAHQQAELHSLGHALTQWADRVRLPEVRNLVMLLIQSEKLGADAAATLSELATNFRTNARQRAEAQANRLSFWMLFPSVFCFLVASAIVLVGPAYLEYFQYQKEAARMIDETQETVRPTTPSDAITTQETTGEN